MAGRFEFKSGSEYIEISPDGKFTALKSIVVHRRLDRELLWEKYACRTIFKGKIVEVSRLSDQKPYGGEYWRDYKLGITHYLRVERFSEILEMDKDYSEEMGVTERQIETCKEWDSEGQAVWSSNGERAYSDKKFQIEVVSTDQIRFQEFNGDYGAPSADVEEFRANRPAWNLDENFYRTE